MRKKLRAIALLLAVSLSLTALSAPASAAVAPIPTLQPEDTFQFSNSAGCFSSYRISSTYLSHLKENEPRSYQAYIDQMSGRTWQGSCFGMSAVYCLVRGGGIDLWRFQEGADTLRELKYPKDSQSIQDLVNYYMLAQCTSAVSAYAARFAYSYDETNRRWVNQEVNQQIVEKLKGEHGCSLLAFSYSGGGHTVVAKSIATGSDENYHISIWDPNYPNRTGGELEISKNYDTAKFGLAAPSGYNDGLRLMYVMPYSTRAQTYDAKSIRDMFEYRVPTASASTPPHVCLLTSSVGTFTVTAGDGRAAVVRDGEQTAGLLSLARLPLTTGQDGAYRYLVHENDAKDGLTISFDAGNNEVQYVSDSLYTRVSAVGLTDVSVSGDTVTAACAGGGGQNVVLVSDRLDSARDQITAAGQGASLTLGVEDGQVRVSSDAAASVTVTAANVATQAVSSTQTLVTGPDGVLAGPNAAAQNAAYTPPNTYTPPYTGQAPAGQSAASGAQAVPGYSWSAPAADNYYSAFTDVGRSDLYFYPVLWAQRKGVTNGYNGSASVFAPNMPVSRGEAMTFLWRSKGSPAPKGSAMAFSDVPSGSYCAQAVRWAVEQGITNGLGSAASFAPGKQVTRGEMVTFLWRMAGQPGGYADTPFTDVPGYCAQAVRWASAEGIAGGYGSGTTFAPNAALSRADTVSFLWRAAGCPTP